MPEHGSSNIKEKVRRLPSGPGVYLMKDRLGAILYVGKAKNLKKRVATYFQPSRSRILQPKIRALVDLVRDFEVIEVKSESEAILLEGKLIKEWKPRYNTDFTDDKRFLLVRVDLESTIPRFRLVRNRTDERSRYFGPFAHAGPLRRTLYELRRRFGVVLADASPARLPDGRYRLYDDVRRELYTFPNEVTPEEYRERVEQACDFLQGKAREWLEALKVDMERAAEAREYERAAELRDLVRAMEQTLLKTRKFVRDPLRTPGCDEELAELREALALARPPETIECFDISHISGTYSVASMVRFGAGRPDRNQYRRYKIRSFEGNDDFRAMEEVVGRRYRRLADEGKPFPDLIVIDGGRGQVTAALKAFFGQDLSPPPLVGLAKKEETIIFPDERAPLNLPASSAPLRLLQRIRDEAHRFANTFNAELRSRRIRESVLDDFPGLGPKRKAKLMAHFRSLGRLKRATPEEIAQVEGIGPRRAEQLHTFLNGPPDET